MCALLRCCHNNQVDSFKIFEVQMSSKYPEVPNSWKDPCLRNLNQYLYHQILKLFLSPVSLSCQNHRTYSAIKAGAADFKMSASNTTGLMGEAWKLVDLKERGNNISLNWCRVESFKNVQWGKGSVGKWHSAAILHLLACTQVSPCGSTVMTFLRPLPPYSVWACSPWGLTGGTEAGKQSTKSSSHPAFLKLFVYIQQNESYQVVGLKS